MLVATSKDGVKRRLLYNEEVILVDGSDSLSFKIKDPIFAGTFNFIFSDEGEELKLTGSSSDDGNILNITLHKWDNSLGAEITDPVETVASNQKRIWIKFRTFANKKSSLRSFHLTVWVEE